MKPREILAHAAILSYATMELGDQVSFRVVNTDHDRARTVYTFNVGHLSERGRRHQTQAEITVRHENVRDFMSGHTTRISVAHRNKLFMVVLVSDVQDLN